MYGGRTEIQRIDKFGSLDLLSSTAAIMVSVYTILARGENSRSCKVYLMRNLSIRNIQFGVHEGQKFYVILTLLK